MANLKITFVFLLAAVSLDSSVAEAADKREQVEIQFYDAMLGRTYWIVPNATAIMRVDFYDDYGKGFDLDHAAVWHPEKVSSFRLLRRIPLTPTITHHRYDAFKVKFPDGNIRYVRVNHFGDCDNGRCKPALNKNPGLAKYIEGVQSEEPE